jgi:alkylhydroperoxidase/carboxymuconolactone decarboxylase family protein YurZ
MADRDDLRERALEGMGKLFGGGVGRQELLEVLMQMSPYAGIPAAVQALNAAAEVLGDEPAD